MLCFIVQSMGIVLCKRIVDDTNEQLNIVRLLYDLMPTANWERLVDIVLSRRVHLEAGAISFVVCPPFACATISRSAAVCVCIQ